MEWLVIVTLLLLAPTSGPIPSVGSVVADRDWQADLGLDPDADLGPGARGVVCVVFLRAGCPVAELAVEPLGDLAIRFESSGVRLVGVLTGSAAPAERDQFVREHAIKFPVVLDRGRLAARFGATRTPEAVVVDDRGQIRYRGRIDDQYAVGSRRAAAREHPLADALEDLLAGRAVRRSETGAVGCLIEHPLEPHSSDPAPDYRAVASIFAQRCVRCHRPGQVGPFALTTYREVSRRAPAIAEAVTDGRMPPWHADPRFGKFANDARLTAAEQSRILAWIESGCPEGLPAVAPPLATLVEASSAWQIPAPDLVVTPARSFIVPAQGVVEYQYFEVDPDFRTDRWIQAAEIRPGNRRVVHHATVFLRAPGTGDLSITAQGELGSFCLVAMTPGSPPLALPPGMAKLIPSRWRLVFVVHYAPIGSVQEDRTSLGLRFADPATVRQEVATNLLVDPELTIPPGAADHWVERSRRFDQDVLLLNLFPHMHYRGKSFRFEAIWPDGRIETLLNVPRFDMAWQHRYDLAEPRFLPAGTTLRAVARYDNSAANPANPDPTATVHAGPQSTDEMFNGYYDFVRADQDRSRPPGWSQNMGDQVPGPLALLIGTGAALRLLAIRRRRGGSRPFQDHKASADRAA